MYVRAAGKTDIGVQRQRNEDSLLVAPDLGLYVIADGIGGHRAGEVASRMAVDTIADYWRQVRSNKPPAVLQRLDSTLPKAAQHLVNSITLTNLIIHEAQKLPQYHRMGSTVSALLVERHCLWVADVGDSPIYLFEHGQFTQISEEHSFAAANKSLGLVDLPGSLPFGKNVLTRALGSEETVEVFITRLKPRTGSIMMMCSDGLTNYVAEPAIRAVLSASSVPLADKVDRLIDEANRGGGGDNISVILLEILAVSQWEKLTQQLSRAQRHFQALLRPERAPGHGVDHSNSAEH
jgi:protein phosphatase